MAVNTSIIYKSERHNIFPCRHFKTHHTDITGVNCFLFIIDKELPFGIEILCQAIKPDYQPVFRIRVPWEKISNFGLIKID
jgi:hypothetical protein